MVFQKSLEILPAVFGEEESIDLGPEFLERLVGRREERTACMWTISNIVSEACFLERKLESAKMARNELNYLVGRGWWEEERVDAVDYAVGAKLLKYRSAYGLKVGGSGRGEENARY